LDYGADVNCRDSKSYNVSLEGSDKNSC
jgi:hypothetical protein